MSSLSEELKNCDLEKDTKVASNFSIVSFVFSGKAKNEV